MRIIPRAEWGARHDNGFGPRKLPATQVWLHHSVSIAPDLIPPFDDDYAAIRTLEQIGENRFGKGISYTWCVTPAGLIFEGHSVDRVGSHTADRNTISCGLCFVGNYDNQAPTTEQLYAAAWVLQHATTHRWITAARLNGGHRDLKATSCPGQHAYDQIATINQLAAGGPITEEDMALTADQNNMLVDIFNRVKSMANGNYEDPYPGDLQWLDDKFAHHLQPVKASLERIETKPPITDEQVAAMAAQMAPVIGELIEAGATPEQVEAAVRKVFADAGAGEQS